MDIRKKLQKLEAFAGKNATELLAIANKVFFNCDQTACQEAEKRMKQKAALLAAALSKPEPLARPPHKSRGPDPRERNSLSCNQCAYCKEKDHWKNESLAALRREPKQQVC